jgi:DNA polymerase
MNEIREMLKSIKVYLETDKLIGIHELLMDKALIDETKVSIRENRGGVRVHKGDNGGRISDLEKGVEECKACLLNRRRTKLVFGAGNPEAALMFVGEAPGADEDLQGLPFVGRAGQLLTKMIEAINMRREDVYIANILKCRPPNNRPPMPEEVAVCSPFLTEQIKIIHPRVICALGKFAAQFLLKSDAPISALRGKFHSIEGMGADDILVMPTYHPAYLLRNPNDKRLVWEDLKKIRDELKKR